MAEKGHVPKDQALWNALASLAFVALLLVVFSVITKGGWHVRALYHLGAFDFAVMGLATFRLIRLVSYDKIFSFVREFFLHHTGKTWVKADGGFKRLMSELIECMWCTGLWSALFVVALYLGSSLGMFFVYILAIASIGSFLQNISKAIAHTFE